jgi:hypothetical protein
VILAIVANAAPVVEAVEVGRTGGLMLERSASRKGRLMAGTQFHARALAIGFAFPFPNRDRSDVSIGIDVKAIVARFENREGLVGRIDFVSLTSEQMADVQIEGALVEFDLHDIVANVRESKAGLGVHAEGGTSEVQLGTRYFVGPHAVGGGKRAVDYCGDPIVNPARLK